METAQDLFQHELRSMYDGAKRLARPLVTMAKATSSPDLSTQVEDLGSILQEQTRRLEEIFELLGEKPAKQESTTIQGFIEEFRSFRGERPSKETMDVFVAHVAADIASYAMDEYESMLQVAEHAGVTNASPKIADNLQVSMKEHKKLQKDVKKLTEKLIQQLRPA